MKKRVPVRKKAGTVFSLLQMAYQGVLDESNRRIAFECFLSPEMRSKGQSEGSVNPS